MKTKCSRGLFSDGYCRRPSGMNTLPTRQYLCKPIPQQFSSPKWKMTPTKTLGNDVRPGRPDDQHQLWEHEGSTVRQARCVRVVIQGRTQTRDSGLGSPKN